MNYRINIKELEPDAGHEQDQAKEWSRVHTLVEDTGGADHAKAELKALQKAELSWHLLEQSERLDTENVSLISEIKCLYPCLSLMWQS